MKTLRELHDDVRAALEKASIEDADLDARLLITEAFDLSPISFALDKDRVLDGDGMEKLNAMIEKRCSRIPMSQIFGEKEFWSLPFKVTSDTLTPRPDSETLIEAALKTVDDRGKDYQILDLGTGTGCLLLSLLSELPNAYGTAVDISEKAIDVAKENARHLKLDTRADFLKSNWFSGLDETIKFDIIISNPPYIGLSEKEALAPEVKDHEPEAALFSGDIGLEDYVKIAAECAKFLKPHGILVLEIGYRQARDVNKIFISAGFNEGSLHKDLGGRDRCLIFNK